jgi:TRAP-type C4-dicarboxylate transport system substrate-binding protein
MMKGAGSESSGYLVEGNGEKMPARTRLLRAWSLLTAVLFVAACGQTDGVVAAGVDIEPMTITVATFEPAGHWISASITAYGDEVTRQSDGQITFDYHYGGGLLSGPELLAGIGDNVAQLGHSVPIYTPEVFPWNNWLSQLAFLGDGRPIIGNLQTGAAFIAASFEEQFVEEMHRAGLQPLVPTFASMPYQPMFCREPATSLDAVDGLRVRAAGPVFGAAASNLGMEPVPVAPAEMFEAYQRGVVECLILALQVYPSYGLYDVGGTVNSGIDANLPGFASNTLVMNKETWDSMPVAVQQVFWDSLPAYLEATFKEIIDAEANAVLQGLEQDIPFLNFDTVMEARIREHQETVLAEAPDQAPGHGGGDIVGTLQEQHEYWRARVLELGLEPETSELAGWAQAYDPDSLDLTAWAEELWDRVFRPHRP